MIKICYSKVLPVANLPQVLSDELTMIRRIGQCLNPQLQTLYQKVVQLDKINDLLKHHIPSPLNKNCRAGWFNLSCLVIVVTNASWATELRYLLPELRDQLRKKGLYQLSSLKIAIDANPPSDTANNTQKLTLSSAARDSLLTASELCSYQPLKDALYHLAKT